MTHLLLSSPPKAQETLTAQCSLALRACALHLLGTGLCARPTNCWGDLCLQRSLWNCSRECFKSAGNGQKGKVAARHSCAHVDPVHAPVYLGAHPASDVWGSSAISPHSPQASFCSRPLALGRLIQVILFFFPLLSPPLSPHFSPLFLCTPIFRICFFPFQIL